jgi:hypothetical protein
MHKLTKNSNNNSILSSYKFQFLNQNTSKQNVKFITELWEILLVINQTVGIHLKTKVEGDLQTWNSTQLWIRWIKRVPWNLDQIMVSDFARQPPTQPATRIIHLLIYYLDLWSILSNASFFVTQQRKWDRYTHIVLTNFQVPKKNVVPAYKYDSKPIYKNKIKWLLG